MLECVDVNIKPATLVSQFRFGDEFRCSLRRCHVQEVEVFFNDLSVRISESRSPVVFVDSDQLVFEELIDAFALADIIQSSVVIIVRREHDRRHCIERYIRLVSDAILAPCVFAKIENLHGSASTLDRELGAGEDSVATLEAIPHDRGFVCTF